MNKIEILTCHCKKVEIELNLENGVEELVRCNCSLCKRRGYITVSYTHLTLPTNREV